MKGMFVKNWIVMWSGLKPYFILFTVAAFLDALVGQLNNSFLVIFPWMILCLMIALLLEYNNKCNWELYGDTLPTGREGTVQGMYLFALSYFVGFFVLDILATVLLIVALPEWFSISGLMTTSLVVLSVPTLIFALSFPVYYAFGYMIFKAVHFIAVFLVILLGAGIGLFGLFVSGGVDFTEVAAYFGIDLTFVLPCVLAIATVAVLALYFLSMLLSSRLYKSVER
ncbi:MAG: ABC-2 transporter permease [Acutalibacteraceae bacterium]